MNPFDISNKEINRFKANEIKEKKDANEFKELFGKFLCGLWAEEYGILNFNDIKGALKLKKKNDKKKLS